MTSKSFDRFSTIPMSSHTELREEVETLAMKCIVGDFSDAAAFQSSLSALVGAVAGIHKSAVACECTEVARIANELAHALGAGADSAMVSEALHNGITALQQAVENAPNAATPDRSKAAPPTSLAQDPELLGDFVLEAREHLSAIESRSLALEQDPGNAEAIHSIFRAFHTMKGLAGFLELGAVQEVSHEVETVLDLARNSKLTITARVIDVILESADYLKIWVDYLDAGLHGMSASLPAEHAALLIRVRNLLTGEADPEPAAPEENLVSAERIETEVPAVTTRVDPTTAPAAAERAQNATPEAKTVKVDTAKLDYLVDMAGEMVIAQSMVRHDPDLASLKSPRLQRNLAQLARITSEIQKTSMAMRLVPIGQLFQRVARQVRDLSRKIGKPAELDMSGEETEIDRTIVEELADPLMHMVRNALDHGIEDPAGRSVSGKATTARIGLRAFHQAGHIVIEISDDGRGLDRTKILAKAAERGLVAATDHLSESDIFNLIFQPGFSTADQVTDVSGRGVGMDVVRKQIQKLRGRVEIQSSLGIGTTFTLKVPLTLAIIDGLVVGVGSERYIVPLFAVREMFRPSPGVISTVQNQGEMALVRGSLLPVIRLYRKFRVTPRSEDPGRSLLIVAESESKKFCLMVDELIGKQEAVIKSLGESFKNVSGVAGGAILGDGRVGLILDLNGLVKDRRHE